MHTSGVKGLPAGPEPVEGLPVGRGEVFKLDEVDPALAEFALRHPRLGPAEQLRDLLRREAGILPGAAQAHKERLVAPGVQCGPGTHGTVQDPTPEWSSPQWGGATDARLPKNRGMKKALLLVLGILASCASQERRVLLERQAAAKAQITTADCGLKPVFHRSMAEVVFDTVLNDPESARITYHDLEKGWVCNGIDDPGAFCWKMPVTVNAKNAFGGYTGAQTWVFWFNNTQMLFACDGEGQTIFMLPANDRVGFKPAAPGK